MNAVNPSADQQPLDEAGVARRAAEKEGVWQQIQQHFQTTQTSLSLRLVCRGKVVQQVGDVKSGVREAARLFTLQDSPQKAEELIASQENLFNRKCQQWEQTAKSAEAAELYQKAPLCYLTCSVKTEIDFDTAVQQSYLLEFL